jgi:feruloyl esterase
MKVARVIGVCFALALSAHAQESAILSPSSCERLASMQLSNATVTSASQVAQGAFTAPGAARPMTALPAFCRVASTAKPTGDSEIKVEVWLPASGWNGKFQAVGNGGWAGTIAYAPMGAALTRGYATASTDTGHSTPGASFSVGHPEKLIDYAHRSLHEMAVAAKAVVNAHYGKSPSAAVWNGCSTGGNQGLTLASMYPADFDAIIAGASPDPRARLHGVRLLAHRIVHRSAGSYIPPQKYPAMHKAVMDACDARDGVKDGVLENPRSCRFDPKVLQCKDADGPSCLTAEQVETMRALYSDVKHPRTGRVQYSPLLVPGSELNWGILAGPQPFGNAAEAFKYLVAKDAAWDPSRFNGDADLELMDTMGAVLNTPSPNLKPFFAGGGKLLMYHGWNDQQVPALSSAVGKSIQLYMVPGMNHCQGGVGTDTFDKVAAIEQWMTQGRAPDQIVASHATEGKIDRTRPLCPYPHVAVYNGSGSTDEASSFSCRVAP